MEKYLKARGNKNKNKLFVEQEISNQKKRKKEDKKNSFISKI